MFPNTQSDCREVDLSSQKIATTVHDEKEFKHLLREASTQTDHNITRNHDNFSFKAQYQTSIQQKAFSGGMRIEDVSFSSQKLPIIENKPGVYWQIPKTTCGHTAALHHQVCNLQPNNSK